jgi:hypothetical protein
MPLLTNTQLSVIIIVLCSSHSSTRPSSNLKNVSVTVHKYRALEDVLLSGIVDENVLTAYSEINTEDLHLQMQFLGANALLNQ